MVNTDPEVKKPIEDPIVIPEPETVIPKHPSIYYDTLVLAGASTKGLITLGAIQYAYDNHMLKNLQTYIGTSSGAMICYLLAIGYTPVEIMVYICTNQLMEKMQHFNIVAMIQGRGATSFNAIQEQLEKMSIAKIGYLPTLNDLKLKHDKILICVTHNITENCAEYLSWETHPHLPCITALRMSSNLPLIFENYKYGHCMYVDGGISDNFAIDIAEKKGTKIMGIMLAVEGGNFSNEPDINTLEFIYKLMFVPINQYIEYKIHNASDKCRIVRLNHNKLKFFQFDVSSSIKLDMFSSGFEQMKKILD
jgi:predicted patatin/cPLA2 family phospholipase